jgi:hypothetical protein
MKTIHRTLLIIVLLLGLGTTVFAQGEIEEPAPTVEVTTEAVVNTEVPVEATVVVVPEIPLAEPVAPNETVDVQTWVDDVLEYLSGHTGEIILGVALLIAVLKIKQPMTADEKAREDAEIARQREEARLTPEPVDDLLVAVRMLVNSMRRTEDGTTTPPFTVNPVVEAAQEVKTEG